MLWWVLLCLGFALNWLFIFMFLSAVVCVGGVGCGVCFVVSRFWLLVMVFDVLIGVLFGFFWFSFVFGLFSVRRLCLVFGYWRF